VLSLRETPFGCTLEILASRMRQSSIVWLRWFTITSRHLPSPALTRSSFYFTSRMLNPLITVCGTTGVGKSKLAIELALKLAKNTFGKHGWHGARVINADSMQVYRGLDIITNKVSTAEMQGVDHLLMDFKEPGEQYVVGEWVEDSLKLVSLSHVLLGYWARPYCTLSDP
jgi:IPP transferase